MWVLLVLVLMVDGSSYRGQSHPLDTKEECEAKALEVKAELIGMPGVRQIGMKCVQPGTPI